MTKTIKSLLVLFSVLGLLAGCSSTPTEPEDDGPATAATPEPVETPVATPSISSYSEYVEDAGVATVFYFEFDSSVLSDDSRAALIVHAEALSQFPQSIRLEGHADERGTREYNMALGESRAKSVRDFLVLQGVDASSIETISYGEESPIATGSYEGAWSQNRRVELK